MGFENSASLREENQPLVPTLRGRDWRVRRHEGESRLRVSVVSFLSTRNSGVQSLRRVALTGERREGRAVSPLTAENELDFDKINRINGIKREILSLPPSCRSR